MVLPRFELSILGYKEVKETLRYRFLRQIRGDNYCALRSTIFQTLARGLSVPSSAAAMERLSQAQDIGSRWYQHWRFNGLPYTGTNLLRGMEICLQSLDNIHALLQSNQRSVEEREDTLQHLLNTDPTLDLHLMEAVKLHMMVAALNLHDSYSKGQDVPLFSILLFARDTSEVPLDFMNNHLVKVGNTGGLEQNLSRFVNASKVWRATAPPGDIRRTGTGTPGTLPLSLL
ncbi:hypothetical protein J6590_093452 [Homalodisca vitripennis]|nr:hypothetical protein J6590_093452 [Homalodisca vitripennis]